MICLQHLGAPQGAFQSLGSGRLVRGDFVCTCQNLNDACIEVPAWPMTSMPTPNSVALPLCKADDHSSIILNADCVNFRKYSRRCDRHVPFQLQSECDFTACTGVLNAAPGPHDVQKALPCLWIPICCLIHQACAGGPGAAAAAAAAQAVGAAAEQFASQVCGARQHISCWVEQTWMPHWLQLLG